MISLFLFLGTFLNMRVRIRKDFAIHVPYVWRILKIWNLSLVCKANGVPWLTGLGSCLYLCVCLNIILDAIVVHSRKLRCTAIVNGKKKKSGNCTIVQCWLCCWPIYLTTITLLCHCGVWQFVCLFDSQVCYQIPINRLPIVFSVNRRVNK